MIFSILIKFKTDMQIKLKPCLNTKDTVLLSINDNYKASIPCINTAFW